VCDGRKERKERSERLEARDSFFSEIEKCLPKLEARPNFAKGLDPHSLLSLAVIVEGVRNMLLFDCEATMRGKIGKARFTLLREHSLRTLHSRVRLAQIERNRGCIEEHALTEKRQHQNRIQSKLSETQSSTAHSKEAVHPSTTVAECVFCTTRRRRRSSTFLRESTESQRKRTEKDEREDVQEGQSSDVDGPSPDDVHLLDRAIVNDLEAQDDAVKLASKGSQ